MCSICKEKLATLFLSNISSKNEKQDLDLCDACAKAKGIADPSALIDSANVMLGLDAPREIKTTAFNFNFVSPALLALAKKKLLANSWRIITP